MSVTLIEKIVEFFCIVIGQVDDIEYKYAKIQQCSGNIEQNVAVRNSIKLIKKLVETFPLFYNDYVKVTRNDVVARLCGEYHVIENILKNIEQNKQKFSSL